LCHGSFDVAEEGMSITSEESEKLRRWRSEFQQDFQAFKTWQDKKREWERFYDGDQLSTEEKNALRDRGQPEVVINLIKPRVDGVIGDFLGQRVMMRARDRGSNDFDAAKYVTEALRYIEDQNRFDDKEAKVAEDLFIGGVGWYKATLEFDFLEPEIRIAHRSNDDVVVDRRCRRTDLRDAKRLYETIWVESEDLIELYPEHKKFIKEAAERDRETWVSEGAVLREYLGDNYAKTDNASPDTGWDFETFLDPGRKRIRLINVWERVQKRVEFAFHPDLPQNVVEITEFAKDEIATLKQNFPGAQIFARTKWELNSGIFICNKILEEKENVRPHDSEGRFPFARAVGHVEHSDVQIPYGIVKQYVDAQKEYNKRRSKLLHKSNTNRILAEEGAFLKNDIERIRKEASRPDGVVVYKAGRKMEIDSGKPEQTDVFLLQLAQSEIEASGVAREFIGTEDKQLSGRAINLRQIHGQKMLRPFYAALRSARRDLFSIVLDEIQQFWTSEKLVKITDDEGAKEIIFNQRVALPDGTVGILNNLRLGKYDIKIDEDAETPNQRQEIFNQLAQLGQVAVQAGEPFPLEMLIKSSDLPNKDEWLQAIMVRKQQQAAMMQAQLQLAQYQAMSKTGAGSNGQNVTPT